MQNIPLEWLANWVVVGGVGGEILRKAKATTSALVVSWWVPTSLFDLSGTTATTSLKEVDD
jgi:hypothetical protein